MHTTRHGTTPTNRSANLGGNRIGIDTPPPILVLIPTNLHTANFLPLPSPLSLLAIYSMQTSTRSLSGYPKPLKPKPDQSKAKQARQSEAKQVRQSTRQKKSSLYASTRAAKRRQSMRTLTCSHVIHANINTYERPTTRSFNHMTCFLFFSFLKLTLTPTRHSPQPRNSSGRF
jgi:hypothetical protein